MVRLAVILVMSYEGNKQINYWRMAHLTDSLD